MQNESDLFRLKVCSQHSHKRKYEQPQSGLHLPKKFHLSHISAFSQNIDLEV